MSFKRDLEKTHARTVTMNSLDGVISDSTQQSRVNIGFGDDGDDEWHTSGTTNEPSPVE